MTPVDIDKLKELVKRATPGWCGAMVAAFGLRSRRATTPQDVRQCMADLALAEQLATAMPQLAALIAKAERVDALEGVALSALALLNNINEFGADTDSEFYDAVDAQIRSAAATMEEQR